MLNVPPHFCQKIITLMLMLLLCPGPLSLAPRLPGHVAHPRRGPPQVPAAPHAAQVNICSITCKSEAETP